MTTPVEASASSQRSRGVTLALAAILGPFGAHRFYVGKNGTGLLMLATLGGLGVWYVYDLITIAGGSFRDASGRLVTRWDPESVTEEPAVSEAVLQELDVLRSEVASWPSASISPSASSPSHAGSTPRSVPSGTAE